MTIDISKEAEDRLSRYFNDGGWELYDGVPVAQNNELSVCDIVLSISLNSRLNTREQVWNVWKEKVSIESRLSLIPVSASLEDENIQWDDIYNLFSCVCDIPNIAGAKATKILHKKRPYLIPIFDSVIESYWKRQIPGWSSMTWATGLIAYMKLFQHMLLENQNRLHDLCTWTEQKGWSITPVRALEVLTWIEIEPNAQYK